MLTFILLLLKCYNLINQQQQPRPLLKTYCSPLVARIFLELSKYFGPFLFLLMWNLPRISPVIPTLVAPREHYLQLKVRAVTKMYNR